MRNFSLSAVGTLSTKITGLLLALGVSAIAARLLGPESFGQFSVIVTLLNVLAISATLGSPVLVLRIVGKENATEGSVFSLRDLSGRLVGTVSGFIVIGSVVGFVYLYLSDKLYIFGASESMLILMGGGMFSICIVLSSFVRAKKAVIEAQIIEVVLRPFLFLVGLGICAFLLGEISVNAAIYLFVLAGLIAGLVGILRFKYYYNGFPSWPTSKVRSIRDGLLIFGLINAAQVLNSNVDMLLLGSLGTDEDAGIYRVAFSMAMLVAFPLAAANSAFGPWYSEYIATNNRSKLNKLIGWAGIGVTGITTLIVIIMAWFAESLLGVVFGVEYLAAVPVMLVLMAGQIINSLAGPVALLLNFMHDEKFVLKVLIFSLFISIVLNSILIPIYGALGAAIANAVALTIWNVVLMGRSFFNHGINPTFLSIWNRT